jgi:hypothetical protein
MSKERDQDPCLSKEELELGWCGIYDRNKENHKPKTDGKCDLCRLKEPTRKLKTSDGMTLNVCEECFLKGP